ncbi:uncharacterized protein [Euwallacea similis]|uniref:uncharacterized protein n=1 Tax=Euwallacea similis TaxID=1736056 RepID=UPI00344D4F41
MGTTDIKIAQINLGRDKRATDLMFMTIKENNIDIILISEPNKNIAKAYNWLTDSKGDTAILIINKNIKINKVGTCKGACWLELENNVIYSCYISPNINTYQYENYLHDIGQSMKTHKKPVLMGGDFNAKSPAWNERREDANGRSVTEWMAQYSLVAVNSHYKPTFVRNESTSIIDITLATDKIISQIGDWQVLEEESLSFHKYITYRIHSGQLKQQTHERINGWKMENSNMETLNINFKKMVTGEKQNIKAENITDLIIKTCNTVLTRRKNTKGHNKKAIYWWNDTISQLRKDCLRKNRERTRINKKDNISEEEKIQARQLYKEARKNLRKTIGRAKAQAWDNLLKDLDEDIWSHAYKIVRGKIKINQPRLTKEKEIEIYRELFPIGDVTEWEKEAKIKVIQFSEQELRD